MVAVLARATRRDGPAIQVLAFVSVGLLAEASLRYRPEFSMLVLAAVATAVGIGAWRHPVVALCGVAIGMTFNTLVLGWLYRHGVPGSTLRLAAYWKEGLLVIVCARAWRDRAKDGRHTDRVELAAVAFLVLIGIYVALPFGGDLRVRYIAARTDAAFVVLFLVARSLRATAKQRVGFERVIVASGTLLAALGLWNYFDGPGWTRWINGTGTVDYVQDVLRSSVYEPVLRTAFGSSTVTRVGSIFLDPIALAYLLLVVTAVAAGRLLRGVGGPLDAVGAVVCVLCTFLTFTRSAIALLPVLGLVLAIGSGRLTRHIGVLLTGALGLAVVAGFFGVGGQVASGFDTNDPRTALHVEALGNGVERVVTNPVGTGLGTVAGVSDRFDVEGALPTTENFYLQIGTEVGILGAAVFVAFTVLLCQGVFRRAREEPDGVALAAAAGLVCVALGGLALHTFANIPVTWPLFVLAGLALGDSDREHPWAPLTR